MSKQCERFTPVLSMDKYIRVAPCCPYALQFQHVQQKVHRQSVRLLHPAGYQTMSAAVYER